MDLVACNRRRVVAARLRGDRCIRRRALPSHRELDERRPSFRQPKHSPDLRACRWIRVVDPQRLPSEWLSLDLGPGELSALALALENPQYTVLLDDALARRIAQSAGLIVWGTLRVLLEAKKLGLTPQIAPLVDKLESSGMWISADIRRRVLALADETGS